MERGYRGRHSIFGHACCFRPPAKPGAHRCLLPMAGQHCQHIRPGVSAPGTLPIASCCKGGALFQHNSAFFLFPLNVVPHHPAFFQLQEILTWVFPRSRFLSAFICLFFRFYITSAGDRTRLRSPTPSKRIPIYSTRKFSSSQAIIDRRDTGPALSAGRCTDHAYPSVHHPFNGGRRSSSPGGASDSPYVK